MMRWTMVVLVLAAPAWAAAEEGARFDHSALDRVLSAYVDEGGQVDYAGLKAHPQDLEAYVALLGRVRPASHPAWFPTREDRLAYWINAYNAFVIKGVVDAYPVKSVKKIKLLSGFFNRTYFTAGGESYTLNDIEHNILRAKFKDPRIHTAINCASVGCPRLEQKAFRPEDLDARLEAAMRFFIREARNVRIDRTQSEVTLSKIFEWFEEDFTGWYKRTYQVEDAKLIDYLRMYLPEVEGIYLKQNRDVQVQHVDYDWTLNDQALTDRAPDQ